MKYEEIIFPSLAGSLVTPKKGLLEKLIPLPEKTTYQYNEKGEIIGGSVGTIIPRWTVIVGAVVLVGGLFFFLKKRKRGK